ncbi:hypothetical protein PM082_003681 [Marasmius tenuissimus]|nr:hypothetical protein PM082_003681 [Marasmius tenuissimus]
MSTEGTKPPTSSSDPVLVTGGSGFIGSALVAALLEQGHIVHTTVRSLANKKKVAPLHALSSKYPSRLNIFEADLLKPESFDAAIAGCAVVHHVASPFRMPEKIVDGEKEMVTPAIEGVINVFGSVERTSSVKRVVLTSTVGAIFGSYSDVLERMEGGRLSEKYWNESSSVKKNPYHYGKTVAEKEAWKFHEAQEEEGNGKKRWDLVVINPGLVLGPSLAPESESGSLFLLDELMGGGLFFGVPDLSFAIVDVRDVVAAHCAAANRPNAHGRYVVVAEKEMVRFITIAGVVRQQVEGLRRLFIPSWQIPNWVVRLVGPLFGLDNVFIREHIGVRFTVDNDRAIEELGVEYRPLEETLRDHCACRLKQRQGGGEKETSTT